MAWAQAGDIADAVHVACGEYATCALRRGGKVSCWGQGIATGNGGAADPQLTPFDTVPSGAVDVAMGDRHGCALLEDATVKCWCGAGLWSVKCWCGQKGGSLGATGGRELGFGPVAHRAPASPPSLIPPPQGHRQLRLLGPAG